VENSKPRPQLLWNKLSGDPVRAFGSLSLLLLISLAIAPAKDHFSQWRHYQNSYLKMIRSRSDAVTLRRHFREGIQQIWNPELEVVDRCTTCHVGVNEAGLTDISLQPFCRHPVIPHNTEQFGCVLCHRGQGAATTVKEAHMSTVAWEQPLLPERYIESSCGQCHRPPLTGTPHLNEGRRLMARYGCVHCHTVKLPEGGLLKAEDDAPSLSHIADKTTREWIYAWLKDPQAYATSATMPNFKLNDEEAGDISAFLIRNSTPVAGDALTLPQKAVSDSTAGASLYGESFCATCHAVQNAAGNVVGGDVGPELTRIGNKVRPEWLAAWIKNPRVYDPPTEMPHYRFTDAQVAVLTGYLQAKSDSDFLANIHLEPATPDQINRGKLLVTEYGCTSCHEISGIRKPDNFAPELTRIGSKPSSQLIFAPGIEHTLPDYISGKLRQPRAFAAGLKMPQYNFTAAQIDAITTALLSLNERAQTLPAALTVPPTPASNYQPAGKAGQLMNDLACFSCHRINGRGSDMAPDLTWEGSAVQRKWLEDFLQNPNTLRPALIRRMPKFNLTPDEISTLSDYIMAVYQTPSFDRESMANSGYPAVAVEQGRQLFYSKYGCQACHIVDAKADKGYIGPTLTEVGSRLNAAWVYHWLKDPQALRPGTIEPNRNLTDEDARALTVFLISQKGSGRQETRK